MKSEVVDVGTKELAHRYTLKPELIGQNSGHSVHMRVMDETEMDRLLLRGMLTVEEHSISQKLYADLRRANFTKMPMSKLEPSAGGYDPHGALMSDHMISVGKMFAEWDRNVGLRARNLATDVLLDMRTVNSATELELLRMILLLTEVRMEQKRK